MNPQVILLTEFLSRQLVALQKKLARGGVVALIAAPKNHNDQYSQAPRIFLRKICGRLLGAGKIRDAGLPAVCFDSAAVALAVRAGAAFIAFNENIGIDLSVWNPKAVSGNRQIQLLSKYNIAPHQRMILAVDADERAVKSMTAAISSLDRDDFIIAAAGPMPRRAGRRINVNPKRPPVIYLGDAADLPSLMRASYAIISLGEKDSFYRLAAASMGRMTAWKGDGIKPSVVMKSTEDAIAKLLDMSTAQREKLEDENARRAAVFDLDKSVEKVRKFLNKETL